jgi:hypothetical protein
MYSKLLVLFALLNLSSCAPQYAHRTENDAADLDSSLLGGTDAHSYADEDTYEWSQGAVAEYPIHDSCNATETALLSRALHEAELLAAHARDHTLRFGNSSSYFVKYFGKASTVEPAGWYNKIVNAHKGDVLFRCDNIDDNCALDGTSAG